MLDAFWALFSKILRPEQQRICQNQLLILNLDEAHLIESFAGFLILFRLRIL